jgi:hypothetical protein
VHSGLAREREIVVRERKGPRWLAWPQEVEPLFDRAVGAICPWLPFRRRHPWTWRTEESFPDIDVRGESSRAVSPLRSRRRGGRGQLPGWRAGGEGPTPSGR